MPRSQEATLLVAEDNLTHSRTLADVLTKQGYHVLNARNGVEALELLRTHLVNLVLTDVVMPELDGYGLLQTMRADPRLYHLPVVFVTGYATPEDRRKAKEYGVEDYLVKPLDETELLATVRNILARRMTLEESYQRQVDAVRSQILGLVQHEFRTPLTFVMGYAEFLQQALSEDAGETGLQRADLQRSVEAILEGSRRLHHVIESFLMLAGLSTRPLDPGDLYPIDPTALWRECVAARRVELDRAHLQVVLEEPPDPLIVFGVLELLREALMRLLDNAIRYRRSDSTTIWLATVSQPGYVGWMIRDQGVGIPPDLVNQIVQPFTRLPQSLAGGHGIGLGLTLAQRVAQLHGGALTVESREGSGSTFGLWVSDAEPD
jgi:signal transduction histidine kinase